jgi:UDP-N-acetylglucosamine acyltransferase
MARHPTATIHPSAIIEGEVEIGARVVIEAFCYLKGPLSIGEETRLYPHCVIGTDAEHIRLTSKGPIHIGKRNILREFCVVQRGTGDRETTIGDDCFLMDHVHIAHDCIIGNHVTMAPNIVLAGHVRIMEGTNVGMGAVMHQFSTIGAGAMIGMGAVVTKDIPPFALILGNPAVFKRINTHGLKRINKAEDIVRIQDGRIVSDDADVKKLMAAFEAERRQNRPLLEHELE